MNSELSEAPRPVTRPKPRRAAVGRAISAVRADALTRSSALLVGDYLFIGMVGGLCSVIAARGWSPHDVGAVAGITGTIALIVTASSTGIASTITRFLGSEMNQRRFVLEAMIVGVTIGLGLAAIVCFTPNHLGVPLHNLHISDVLAFALIGANITAAVIVAVSDPAFLSRKEVSYAVAKDVTASISRVGIMFALLGTGAVGLFSATIAYVGIAAVIDLLLIFWRLHSVREGSSILRFRMIRERVRFAVGSHTAALVAAVPGSLVVTIVAARLGPTEAAFVGIPLTISAFVTIIPSMTAQALLAELSGTTIDVAATATRALRLAYAATMPAAAVVVLLAPYILLVYGHRYSVHGTGVLRWAVGATLFSTFNYIGDTVLLARQKLVAYNFVNAAGSVMIVVCVVTAVDLGASWVGPALFVGQALYAATSVAMLLRYGSVADAIAAARALRWNVRSPSGSAA